MQGQLSLLAAFMAVIVLSPLVSFAANAFSGPAVPASASTSSGVGDEDKPKDAPAPKKDDAPKAPDASLANWLAQAAAIRMGRELGLRLKNACPVPCYLGRWGSFNAAKDTGFLLDSALESRRLPERPLRRRALVMAASWRSRRGPFSLIAERQTVPKKRPAASPFHG